ncbi:MAG: hypothetical protein NVSMB18_04550 [Acetobacteraceae bacterium]
MMSDPVSEAAVARRDILSGLTQALALLGARMQPQADTAREIAMLAARAEEIAQEAWTIGTTLLTANARLAALDAAFQSFIADAGELSRSAARQTAVSLEVAAAMETFKAEMKAASLDLEGVDDIGVVRARLRPLASSIAALPARIQSGTAIVDEVAALGERALGLAESAEGLHAKGRNSTQSAIAIYRGLRAFAESAAEVATNAHKAAARASGAIQDLREQADGMVSPEAAEAVRRRNTSLGRLERVIAEGALLPSSDRAGAPVPVDGMTWG